MTEEISIATFVQQRKGGSLKDKKILIVGVGGLGCELIKCFVGSGFTNLDIIDMDVIELTNLNRQFLFRPSDIGKSKAVVAAEYFSRIKAYKDLSITAHYCQIQDKDASFYLQFDVIVSGLDSVEARRWLNAMVHSLLEYDPVDGSLKQESIIPLIDGGTEAMKGSVRVILPGLTACFECTIDLFPPQLRLPLCTISNKPRKFAHCLEFAAFVLWKQHNPNESFDADSPVHLEWICREARERARDFGILYDASESSCKAAQRVLKNVIPAISSTNAIIAAMCCNEVLKLILECGSTLNNYFLYNGTESIYCNSFENERLANCLVCSPLKTNERIQSKISFETTVQELVDLLKKNYSFNSPSIRTSTKTVYFESIEQIRQENEMKRLREFASEQEIESNEMSLFISSASTPQPLVIVVSSGPK